MKERIKDAWQCLKGNPPTYTEIKREKESRDVTLEQLGSISEKDAYYREEMSQTEYDEHRSEIAAMANSRPLQIEIEAMRLAQVYNIAQQTYNEQVWWFAKGTLNGISLVQDRLRNMQAEEKEARLHRKREENMDPHDAVGVYE